MEQEQESTRSHKESCTPADVLSHLHAARILRSFTATALMVVGAFAPLTLVHGFAAPPEGVGPRAAIGEVAHLPSPLRTRSADARGGLTHHGAAAPVANLPEETTLAVGASEESKEESESKRLARRLLARAGAVERAVTQDMQRLENAHAQLLGLDYRMKTEDSLARKIASDAREQDISCDEAAGGMHDVLRYTLAIDRDRYQEAVPAVLASLSAQGYTIERFRNAWGGRYYQGVNVQLKNPDGVPVELQLHTPQSFAIKQASHGVYEIRRDPRATDEEKEKARRLSLAYNAQVQVPEGAEALSWPAA